MDAAPLNPPPLVEEELVLRRSARCLNRPTRPSYAEQEPPKKPGGRGRSKRKREEEKPELAPAQQGAKSPDKKDSKDEAGEKKPTPMIAALPVSCAGVAAEDDATGTGKSAKLRVKETLRAFNSHYLHFVQVPLCVWMFGYYPVWFMFFAEFISMLVQEEQKRAQAVLQEINAKSGLKRQTKGGEKVLSAALNFM
jgi:[histone H3]-lysine9 N-trimethyltransferase EHMT